MSIYTRWLEYGPIYTVEMRFSDKRLAEKAARWLRRQGAEAKQSDRHVYVKGNRRTANDVMLAIGHTAEAIAYHPLSHFPS